MSDTQLLDFQLGKLYYAGKVTIPHESETVSEAGRRLFALLDVLDEEFARAGDPPIARTALEICSEVCSAMRIAVYSLDNCAESVIKSADLLRHTDDSAREKFDHLDKKVQRDLTRLEHRAEDHRLPRHELPTDPGARQLPGSAGHPGGPVTVPGAPDVVPTRIGQGDFQPPASAPVPSTPAPSDPEIDRRERATVEQRDRNDNNTTTLPRSER